MRGTIFVCFVFFLSLCLCMSGCFPPSLSPRFSFVFLTLCMSLYLRLYVYLSIHLFFLSIRLSFSLLLTLYLSICLLIALPIYLTIYLLIYQSINDLHLATPSYFLFPFLRRTDSSTPFQSPLVIFLLFSSFISNTYSFSFFLSFFILSLSIFLCLRALKLEPNESKSCLKERLVGEGEGEWGRRGGGRI